MPRPSAIVLRMAVPLSTLVPRDTVKPDRVPTPTVRWSDAPDHSVLWVYDWNLSVRISVGSMTSASPLGELRTDVYDVDWLARANGPGEVQAERQVALLAVPCAEQRLSGIARVRKCEFVTEIALLRVR